MEVELSDEAQRKFLKAFGMTTKVCKSVLNAWNLKDMLSFNLLEN